MRQVHLAVMYTTYVIPVKQVNISTDYTYFDFDSIIQF